jgi:signal transduction histidine kinase
VAALRADELGTDASLAGIADVSPLVDDFRRAGLAVELRCTGPVDDVDGPVATAVHRILREALTNVARHSPGNAVAVGIAADPTEVRVEVVDRGRPAPAADRSMPHYGLVGMGERARALGGELDAGPTADGWRVSASLPRHGAAVS